MGNRLSWRRKKKVKVEEAIVDVPEPFEAIPQEVVLPEEDAGSFWASMTGLRSGETKEAIPPIDVSNVEKLDPNVLSSNEILDIKEVSKELEHRIDHCDQIADKVYLNFNLGLSYYATGRRLDACAQFKQVISLDDTFGRAYTLLAHFLLEEGTPSIQMLQDIVKYLEKALLHDLSEYRENTILLAEVYCLLNDQTSALHTYSLLDNVDKEWQNTYHQAQCHWELQQYKESMSLLQSLASLSEENASKAVVLADVRGIVRALTNEKTRLARLRNCIERVDIMVPSALSEPPLGLRAGDAAAGRGRLWVQHTAFPTIKKSCGLTGSFRAMKKQTSYRVLQELRTAQNVVGDQLGDFRKKLQELDEWIATTQTLVSSNATPDIKRKKKKEKRSEILNEQEPLTQNATPEQVLAKETIAVERTNQDMVIAVPGLDAVLPPDKPDEMDLLPETPCTTTGCWQLLREQTFFKGISSHDIDVALEIEQALVSSPMEPSTDSDDGNKMSPARKPHLNGDNTPCLTSRVLGVLVSENDQQDKEKECPEEKTLPLKIEKDVAMDFVADVNMYLRKELVSIGLVVDGDDVAAMDDSEIAVELRKCERELGNQIQINNDRKSALYHAVIAASATETEMIAARDSERAILKKYQKLVRKKQDAKRKRKHNSKKLSKKQKEI
ncbi:hypothetical protein THRCLA_03991 [Thraustotheca clavata]|uniref:Uncharacterized protein n=1 Tax=Thraustotheca clavata TaxID=74557 RepID=A0A1W0A0Z9_9STRA|nr:hypothetical protein THRCLA_03991 [Thraustotheca clavata]